MTQRPRVLPPVYLAISIIAMGVLHFTAPLLRFLNPPMTYAGLLLIAIGIATSAYASGLFSKAGTPVVPFERSTVLVTNGIYRWTRNPMYLGMIVVLLGVGALCGTIGSLVPIAFFIWLIRTRFVAHEERFLEEIFGEEYLTYKKTVRRWI